MISSDDSEIRPGFPPTREDMFWLDAMRRVVFDSMLGIQHAATVLTVLSGAGLLGYLAWLLSPWSKASTAGTVGKVVALAPAILWTIAICYGTLVFLMRRYRFFANSPDSSRLAFRRIARKKAKYLYRAFGFWLAGVLAVLVVAVL